MKNAAQIKKNIFLAAVLLAVAALAFSKDAWAASGNTQICQPDTSCTIGEFVYDDSYVPVTTATCTITTRYPDGTLFLDGVSMPASAEGDGWYAHSFTAPATLGLYRTEVTCIVGSDTMSLDKTFEVKDELTETSVAESVWNADRDSYTADGSFGDALQNIVPSASDIAAATWGYSTRSLSTFGSVVADVWKNATRLLTGATLDSGSLATKSDIDAISGKTNLLLEQLVNKPVIETSVEETPDLQAKLNETESIATQLFISAQFANSKAGLMKLKWNSFENSQVLDTVQELTRKLGGENDASSSASIFGYISFLKESWNWDIAKTITSQVKAVREILASIQSEVESSGRSKITFSKVTALVSLLSELNSQIGDISNKSSQKTLFGKLKEIKLLAESLDKKEGDTKSLISAWDRYKLADKQRKLSDLSREVVAINRIPSINAVLLSTSSALDKELRNKSYYVLGIISANKKLLAKKTGSTLTSTWLELGSIVFKSLATNPSTLISQKVALKYYLPSEIREEDIIETDEGLTIKYDTEKDQYYVSGEFLLAPSETKTISVKTQDIWVISQEEIDSLRKQAEELSKPLEKTSYFAQGVTIKSDIDVSLDKILALMKSNGTPEAKIRAYREAEIEMKSVLEKTEKLKELVTQAGSTGTLFGFVGGTQTLAVWGLILILTVGFVFLALYMKLLTKKEEKEVIQKLAAIKEKEEPVHLHNQKVKSLPRFRHTLQLAIVLLIFGVGSGLASGVILGRTTLSPNSESKVVATSQVQNSEVLNASASARLDSDPAVCETEKEEDALQVRIIVPLGALINVRSKPSINSSVIAKLKKTAEFEELDRQDGWVQIAIEVETETESYSHGWVSEEFVEKQVLGASEEPSLSALVYETVTVMDTPTGFLRVREVPWGQELAKIYPGDKAILKEEKDDWFEVELQDGTFGWIYSEYATKDNPKALSLSNGS